MTERTTDPAPFPGADADDVAVERFIPPEQTPMDDAAEPAITPSEALPRDPGTEDTSIDDLTVQGGE